VSRYIHLNSVKVAGMKKVPPEKCLHYLWNYKWSSLPGYVGKTNQLDFVEYTTVLAEYGGSTRMGQQRYRERIIEDLKRKTTAKSTLF